MVRASDLTAALDAQRSDGGRICSLLIKRGALELDDAARALGEQRGTPCALAKHLANRDASLAALIPAELGRGSCVLPIGRTSGGALIVAARHPAPALRATLERLVGQVPPVTTPAVQLEQLIAAAYGAAPHDEFDIDLGSAVDLDPLPPPPNVDLLDPDSMRLALSDLDDERVAKDPTQSGLLQINTMASSAGVKITNASGAYRLPTAAPKIAAIKLALEHVASREAASDLAMSFIAGRWRAGAIVVIRDDTA